MDENSVALNAAGQEVGTPLGSFTSPLVVAAALHRDYPFRLLKRAGTEYNSTGTVIQDKIADNAAYICTPYLTDLFTTNGKEVFRNLPAYATTKADAKAPAILMSWPYSHTSCCQNDLCWL